MKPDRIPNGGGAPPASPGPDDDSEPGKTAQTRPSIPSERTSDRFEGGDLSPEDPVDEPKGVEGVRLRYGGVQWPLFAPWAGHPEARVRKARLAIAFLEGRGSQEERDQGCSLLSWPLYHPTSRVVPAFFRLLGVDHLQTIWGQRTERQRKPVLLSLQQLITIRKREAKRAEGVVASPIPDTITIALGQKVAANAPTVLLEHVRFEVDRVSDETGFQLFGKNESYMDVLVGSLITTLKSAGLDPSNVTRETLSKFVLSSNVNAEPYFAFSGEHDPECEAVPWSKLRAWSREMAADVLAADLRDIPDADGVLDTLADLLHDVFERETATACITFAELPLLGLQRIEYNEEILVRPYIRLDDVPEGGTIAQGATRLAEVKRDERTAAHQRNVDMIRTFDSSDQIDFLAFLRDWFAVPFETLDDFVASDSSPIKVTRALAGRYDLKAGNNRLSSAEPCPPHFFTWLGGFDGARDDPSRNSSAGSWGRASGATKTAKAKTRLERTTGAVSFTQIRTRMQDALEQEKRSAEIELRAAAREEKNARRAFNAEQKRAAKDSALAARLASQEEDRANVTQRREDARIAHQVRLTVATEQAKKTREAEVKRQAVIKAARAAREVRRRERQEAASARAKEVEKHRIADLEAVEEGLPESVGRDDPSRAALRVVRKPLSAEMSDDANSRVAIRRGSSRFGAASPCRRSTCSGYGAWGLPRVSG